jgi:hypothetical protein
MTIETPEFQPGIAPGPGDQFFYAAGILRPDACPAIPGIDIDIKFCGMLNPLQESQDVGVVQQDGNIRIHIQGVEQCEIMRVEREGHQDILPACFCKAGSHPEGGNRDPGYTVIPEPVCDPGRLVGFAMGPEG